MLRKFTDPSPTIPLPRPPGDHPGDRETTSESTAAIALGVSTSGGDAETGFDPQSRVRVLAGGTMPCTSGDLVASAAVGGAIACCGVI